MARIFIAGFLHETNTFAPTRAQYEDFVHGEGFPPMMRGAAILEAFAQTESCTGGFVQAMQAFGEHEYIPALWCGTSPSGFVTQDAFERIALEIVQAAQAAKPDALYLDLHGAAVAEHIDDCEGELLQRLRAVLPASIPIVVSLDSHANVSDTMLNLADALVAFRTYPHVDLRATGARAASLLAARLRGEPRLSVAWHRTPFLIALNAQCTDLPLPARVYEQLAQLETKYGVQMSASMGFPAADVVFCGPIQWAYAHTPTDARQALNSLADLIESADWSIDFLDADSAVAQAMQLGGQGNGPVVIADTQDNPGAGGQSNSTGMQRALLKAGAQHAAVGLMVDPAAARAAHAAGVGAEIDIALGGRADMPGNEPLQARYKVEALTQGNLTLAGPMLNGTVIDLGLCAQLSVAGVRIAVTSHKMQMLDRTLFRHVGIEPETMAILVNKSSVHFRADFTCIASHILLAKAPGFMIADPKDLPWKNRR